MYFTSNRSKLLAACQLVGSSVATRTTKPILSQIKAIAANDQLTLMGTDLEVGIRYTLAGVRVEESGEAIFPVSRLVDILRASNDDELSIEADERRCRVNSSSSEYEMPSEDPKEFPDIAVFNDKNYYEVSAGALRKMIQQTVFAAGKDNTKFAMTGVLWEMDQSINLVATDTKRLALATGQMSVVNDAGQNKNKTSLVPTKAMMLLDRMIAEGKDEQLIQICMRQNDVLFRSERSEIYSRLVEGRYPPYQSIIQDTIKKAKIKIVLPVSEFLSSIRQAAIMTDSESVRVSFDFGSGKLKMQSQGATKGKSKVEMPIEYKGEVVSINFDPQYLIEMLKIVDESNPLTLDLIDGNKPALFHNGENYSYLLMPLA